MTLVDTSVWVKHLREGSNQLAALLDETQVLCHPFIIGELACGNLGNREEFLGLLSTLPTVDVAEHDEVLQLIDAKHLYGRGLGWVDSHLLASALLAGCALWTLDKTLRETALQLKVTAI